MEGSSVPLADRVEILFVLVLGDPMRARAYVLLYLVLDRLEAAADVVERVTQAQFDLVEFLRDQRQATEQVVQVGVNLLHAVGDESDFSFHRVHCGDSSVDIDLSLLLETVERLLAGSDFLVHDADLSPHLAHLRLDLAAQIDQRQVVVLQDSVVQLVQSLLHRRVGRLHDIADLQDDLVDSVLEAAFRFQNVVRCVEHDLLKLRHAFDLRRQVSG